MRSASAGSPSAPSAWPSSPGLPGSAQQRLLRGVDGHGPAAVRVPRQSFQAHALLSLTEPRPRAPQEKRPARGPMKRMKAMGDKLGKVLQSRATAGARQASRLRRTGVPARGRPRRRRGRHERRGAGESAGRGGGLYKPRMPRLAHGVPMTEPGAVVYRIPDLQVLEQHPVRVRLMGVAPPGPVWASLQGLPEYCAPSWRRGNKSRGSAPKALTPQARADQK